MVWGCHALLAAAADAESAAHACALQSLLSVRHFWARQQP